MTTRLLFIHALSALHAGTSQGVGVIDLPIARETATGLPYLPGSSIKGTLRDSGDIKDDDKQFLFGPNTEYASDNAGSAQFADARMLLLPVRSLAGTYAWVTSPYVLQRFIRDIGATALKGITDIADWKPAQQGEAERCRVAESTKLKLTGTTVVLEDLDLTADESVEITQLAQTLGSWLFPDESPDGYWRTALKERLCVVREDVLNFLLTTATEVIARIKLKDDTKTVDTDAGALWYEEALPAESVLYGLIVATPIASPKVRDLANSGVEKQYARTINADLVFTLLKPALGHTLQFGGKATVGRGICRAVLVWEKRHANS